MVNELLLVVCLWILLTHSYFLFASTKLQLLISTFRVFPSFTEFFRVFWPKMPIFEENLNFFLYLC